MRIFLVAGSAGSGKGEVAKLIKEYYIYKLENCVITEYSKYLKLFVEEKSGNFPASCLLDSRMRLW